jgi:hypothetical protein
MRRALIPTACVLALCACGQPEQAPPPAPAAEAPAAPAGPLTYQSSTPAANVALTLPERVGQLPALYAKLYSEGLNSLRTFAEGATGEIEELKSAGFPAMPYEREITYAVAAETPRLISLGVTTYENTGGAHPNGMLEGLTWDKAAGAVVSTEQLFRADADMAGADRALCDALLAAKRERTGDDQISGELSACPPLRTVTATLVPSTVAGKAGGVTALFSPYQVGPYAEGAYEIVVPAQAFATALAPQFAAEFEGEPAPKPAPAAAPGT